MMENEKRISRAKRGSAWRSVPSWVTLAMRRLVGEEKVMMCGTMIGEGPEGVRAIQRYPRDKDSPRQLTGIRLTADIK
jgi:hypothetical protein